METKLADIDEPIRAYVCISLRVRLNLRSLLYRAGTADRILAAKEKAREKGIKQR